MAAELSHQEKIAWMAMWCAKNKVALNLEGEVGFGRPCVGILAEGNYPDYEWHDKDSWERIDNNGDVWCPPDAYHKHSCVAVLGRGQAAEEQLYDWLKWFDDNGFIVTQEVDGSVFANTDHFQAMLNAMLGKHNVIRMVKKDGQPAT